MKKAKPKSAKKMPRTRRSSSPSPAQRDTMRPEYDFSKGERGRYARRYAEGTNLVLLEPDVAAEFESAREVNRALRSYLRARSGKRTA
jgi:hypothetical protein